MQLDDPGKVRRRRLKATAVITFFIAAITVPAALYVLHGRKVPLKVAAQASAYVVEAGMEVELTASVARVGLGARPKLSWSGEGVRAGASAARATFVAPSRPGSYSVAVSARISGSVAVDRLTLRVVEGRLADYRPERPRRPAALPAPATLAAKMKRCDGTAPLVKLVGRPCRGANLVVALADPARHRGAAIWHGWQGHAPLACAGRVANLRVPAKPGATPLRLRTLVVTDTCFREIETEVRPESCSATAEDAAGGVFADFQAQLAGSGSFRFSAEPPRRPELRFSYAWDFGDGKRKSGPLATVAHEYEEPRRYRLVRLRVTAGERSAEAVRAVYDRTVPASDDSPLAR